MGETLAKPVKDKHTSTYETSLFNVGCCAMQGWRKTMEDSHVAQLFLNGKRDQLLVGVYDGHNGYNVAKYCGAHMAETVVSQPAFKSNDFGKAMGDAYMCIEQCLSRVSEYQEGGCTASTVIVGCGRIVCANTGDSRAILCRGNGTVVALSEDHKPFRVSEAERVENAGRRIEGGRVLGLALTRAIGDFSFKNDATRSLADQAITCVPDVLDIHVTPDDKYIIVACDGIWDVVSNEECAKFVMEKMEEFKRDVGLVCESLLDRCCAETLSAVGTDNMTVVIVELKPEFFKYLKKIDMLDAHD